MRTVYEFPALGTAMAHVRAFPLTEGFAGPACRMPLSLELGVWANGKFTEQVFIEGDAGQLFALLREAAEKIEALGAERVAAGKLEPGWTKP